MYRSEAVQVGRVHVHVRSAIEYDFGGVVIAAEDGQVERGAAEAVGDVHVDVGSGQERVEDPAVGGRIHFYRSRLGRPRS